MISYNHVVQFQHVLWEDACERARCIVDATAGNGHDTLYLVQHCQSGTQVHAIDCQTQAIAESQQRLADAGVAGVDVQWHLGDHGMVLQQWQGPAIDLLLFNLGYLPAGDHAIQTMPDTTLAAIQGGLDHLAPRGLITIVAYPGTEAGRQEQAALETFIRSLPQRQYDVCRWSPLNQANFPPILYVIKGR